ncbi:MAG: hypothetical protein ABI395_08375 [Sphingobium sp.]
MSISSTDNCEIAGIDCTVSSERDDFGSRVTVKVTGSNGLSLKFDVAVDVVADARAQGGSIRLDNEWFISTAKQKFEELVSGNV